MQMIYMNLIFISSKFRLLHTCLDNRDCISIGFVTNVVENDSFEGMFLGSFSFGVLVNELVFPCTICSIKLKVGIHVSLPIKKERISIEVQYLCVQITNSFQGFETQTNKNHNITFLG